VLALEQVVLAQQPESLRYRALQSELLFGFARQHLQGLQV